MGLDFTPGYASFVQGGCGKMLIAAVKAWKDLSIYTLYYLISISFILSIFSEMY